MFNPCYYNFYFSIIKSSIANTSIPEVKKHLKDKGIDNIAVIGGGIIPEEDKKELENKGISGNFGPGTSMETIIDHIKKVVK